ncbi:MAG: AAA family ATPase [Bacteroidaceae bacterium]|nr:AAA family ATPase [Bacteroidaceae bacterium]
MALYINKGNEAFASMLKDEYVDKTGLIAEINNTLFKERRFTCCSRCRRFGKSMAAKMLSAYYDRSCDSRELFRGLEAERHPDFETHLNKYPVIYVDMTNFMTQFRGNNDIVSIMQKTLLADISSVYTDIRVEEGDDFMNYLTRVAIATGDRFIVIIDEWDAICREFAASSPAMDDYVNFLRRMFKGDDAMRVFAAAYITGILPIKKYKTESALNNFWEYSMTLPMVFDRYFGFTRAEVQRLCQKHGMDYEEMVKWYDGYSIGSERSMFNPSSVMKAIAAKDCANFWASTGAFDAVTRYIQMDFDGLKGDIVKMLGGGSCPVSTNSFGNDPNIIRSRDEVLTLLIHLGYLSYDRETRTCHIPNKEVAEEMESAVKDNGWKLVVDALNDSNDLLNCLLDGEAEEVAAGIQKVHEESASILKYNDENTLSCVINLAFYTARSKYKIIREMPAGRGFADVVFVPWRNVDLPAIVIELKWKKEAVTAIDQIRQKNYPAPLKEYVGEVILCAVNYEKNEKEHTCVIERV